MTTSELVVARHPDGADIHRFAEDVLDDLEVVERAYHHLNFSMPLTTDLLQRAQSAARPADRVLLIGGTALLAEGLVRLGFELDIWQFGGSYLTDAMQALVRRRIGASDLDATPAVEERYDLIVAPLVVEALAAPEEFLRRLRRSLAPGGRLLLATANQSRLDVRLAALRGKPFMPRADAETLSLSWPALRTVRHYHRDEVRAMSQLAGFDVRACTYVSSERAFLEMEPLNLQDYVARKVRQSVMRGVPSLRDVLVLELSSRVGDDLPLKTTTDHLTVSVIVAVRHGGERLRQVLAALTAQTYEESLYELIVLHDGSHGDTASLIAEAAEDAGCHVRALVGTPAEGPDARNRAMAEARGDITAHTDDGCQLPEDWIQAAVAWFDADTAVVAGPVFGAAGSEARHLDVPCSRPDPDEKGVCSRTMFPITNVFYRTAVALAAGGFGGEPGTEEGSLGWDTALAWQLHGAGWRIRFRDEVYQFRLFSPESAGSRGLMRQLHRAAQVPVLMARVPEYRRRTLVAAIFASKQTMYFDVALAGAGLALAQRRRRWLLLAVPWLAAISQRVDLWPVRNWPGSVRTVARIGARQAFWLAGFVRGSIKARRPVL